MKLSNYFLPTAKETPKDAEIISHQLMLKAGMIKQQAAGIYSWMPLGLRVLKRIEAIVRQGMDDAGAVELLMPTIQPAKLWQESGRYSDFGDELLRISDRHDAEMLYGPTNEEMITDIFRQSVKSYKDLPLNLYHIQWKFRDEVRPRFGVMRGREFLMKDAYSFDLDHDSAVESYKVMFSAYMKIFKMMGLQAVPVRAESGPIGGDLSHEFVILADTGESKVYFDRRILDADTDTDTMMGMYAATDDKHDPEAFGKLPAENQVEAKGIEVGHVFHFGTKYSDAMGAKVMDPNGVEVPVHMGSYGIGVSRLVAAIIEANHDDNGIIWPHIWPDSKTGDSIAPFEIGLINLRTDDAQCVKTCDDLYVDFRKKIGKRVLYDDTDSRPGKKFAIMDMIGLPFQVIVGPKGLQNNEIEIKYRKSGERKNFPLTGDMGSVLLSEIQRHSQI